MRYVFEVPGTLPTLNQYVDAERSNRLYAAKVKRQAQAEVRAAVGAGAPCFEGAVDVWMLWVRPDMRSDKDNVAFAKKFVLDALQETGTIRKDSWKLCTPHDFGFTVNKANPRTLVLVQDAWELPPIDPAEMGLGD